MKDTPRLLWTPSHECIESAALTKFARKRGVPEDYHSLWRWSVEQPEEFWGAIWEEFEVEGSYGRVIGTRSMPGTEWFPGAQVSYAGHIFRGKPHGRCAILLRLRCAGWLSGPGATCTGKRHGSRLGCALWVSAREIASRRCFPTFLRRWRRL
jgi:hypothetical protein